MTMKSCYVLIASRCIQIVDRFVMNSEKNHVGYLWDNIKQQLNSQKHDYQTGTLRFPELRWEVHDGWTIFYALIFSGPNTEIDTRLPTTSECRCSVQRRLNTISPGLYCSDFKCVIRNLIIWHSNLGGTRCQITHRWMPQNLANLMRKRYWFR